MSEDSRDEITERVRALREGIARFRSRGEARATNEGTRDPVWIEEPVPFEEFTTSTTHLGLPPLFGRQAEFATAILGSDPKLTFENPYARAVTREYQLGVALWGKGSGKDYVCSIIVCYCIYVLLCLRDPHEYLELAPGEPIDIVNVAYNAEQAKRVFFTKLKSRVENWPWLHERCNVYAGGRARGKHTPGKPDVYINDDFIEFPHKVRAWSRHAQNEGYEGLNILVWLMDEASAFLSKLKKENASAIYGTPKTSASSRFGGRWLGMVISYPRHADDFTMKLLQLAQDDPSLGIYADGPATTWEVNERTREEPRITIRGREVPASLAKDFQEDFEDSLSKYCCEPPLAKEAFFRDPAAIQECVREGRAPLIEWEPVDIPRITGDGGERVYRGVRLTKLGKLPKNVKLYVHGDPGLVNDSFALAIGYSTPAVIAVHKPAHEVMGPDLLKAKGIEPDQMLETEQEVPKTVIVALIVWRPDPSKRIEVDLQNVEDTIFALKAAYPSIGHFPRKRRDDSSPRPTVTFDHWNSAMTIQRMIAKRINAEDEHWSRDFQVDIYRNARTAIYNALVDLPDTPSITSRDPQAPGAIYELERIEFIDGIKVDHPKGGSKDSADAVVRVIQHATEHNQERMSFGTIFGHKSQYPAIPPATPQPRADASTGASPTVTPTAGRTPGGFSFGMVPRSKRPGL